MALVLTPLTGLPLIKPGDDLATMIFGAIQSSQIGTQDNDILVIAQKIVSKSENRLVNLRDVVPTERARQISDITRKDARFVELVLQESTEVLRIRENTLIVVHRNGFVCANAGIDHSNVDPQGSTDEGWVLLLPEDSNVSAAKIRADLEEMSGKRLGVMIIDSHGRAWRMGTVGVAIGLSGLPGLVDLRGAEDLFGFRLKVTTVGAADELAAAASLVMGQAAEGTPVVHVRGFPYGLREGDVNELIRPKDQDLFR